jgi:apolipoprotein N-acyltransferase
VRPYPVNPNPTWRWRLLPSVTAVLLGLSFPPAGLFPLAYASIVPLLVYMTRPDTRRARILSVFIAGTLFHVAGFFWIRHVTSVGMVLLAAYSALYWVAFSSVLSAWRGRENAVLWPFRVAAAWALLEYARSTFLTGIPWFLVGHTQIDIPSVSQIADLAGVPGLTALVVLVNAALAQSLFRGAKGRTRPGAAQIAAALLLLVATVYGAWRMGSVDAETREGPEVLLVQGNIEQSVKKVGIHEREIYDVYANMTDAACAGKQPPEFVIWPETMHPAIPVDLIRVGEMGPFHERARARTAFIVGILLYERTSKNGREWNSAVAVDREGRVSGRYDKNHLVPVGEYFPFHELGLWDFLVRKFTALSRVPGLESGTSLEPLSCGPWRFGMLVCYENAFADISREEVRRGARFLVNVSNEAWYRDSAEMDQMLVLSAFRCIETRTGMARATNSGISAILDPAGRVQGVVAGADGRRKEVAGTLRGRVPLGPGTSLYLAWGEWFVLALLVAIVSDLAGRVVACRAQRGGAAAGGRC